MITRSMSAIAVLAIALSAAVRAQARSYGRDEYGSGNWPSEIIERPLTLAQDLAQLDVPVVFNLIDSTMWKPVFIPARLAYGVNSDVTLAVAFLGLSGMLTWPAYVVDQTNVEPS